MRLSKCPFPSLCLLPTFLLIAVSAQAQQSCESLSSIKIPHVTITSAKALDKGWELPVQEGFISTRAGA